MYKIRRRGVSMWKKEDVKPQGVPEISTGSAQPSPAANFGQTAPRDAATTLPVSPRATACVSQGIKIKGEMTGTEDLFIDGQFEGKLDLGNASLTIGPNGNVKADVTAREVIVRGRVDGKVTGRERIQIWKTGHISGDVTSERIAIEEGGIIRGKVEAGKVPVKASEARATFAGGTSGKTPGTPAASTAPSAGTTTANSATAGLGSD
jgi:cytoskeletal protein CcmA (bactofilin family)